jgi:hypothetical protein
VDDLSCSLTLPASIGPPETKTTGMFRRMAAISMPGVILSQLEMQTMASAQWALTMYSTESAIRSRLGSEYSMPLWPMAMPSSMAMVLNSLATPPAASISRATSWPMSLRCTWPGTNWVKLLTTAMIGLPKSPSFMPVARHRARAGHVAAMGGGAGTVLRHDFLSVKNWTPRCCHGARTIIG